MSLEAVNPVEPLKEIITTEYLIDLRKRVRSEVYSGEQFGSRVA
jgi:hypothetical protein